MYLRGKGLHEVTQSLNHELGDIQPEKKSDVSVYPMPMMLEMSHPAHRHTTFWAKGDNPFFQLYEALWQLGGRTDVASLVRFQHPEAIEKLTNDGNNFGAQPGQRWVDYLTTADGKKLNIMLESAKMSVQNPGRETIMPVYTWSDLSGIVPEVMLAQVSYNEEALNMTVVMRTLTHRALRSPFLPMVHELMSAATKSVQGRLTYMVCGLVERAQECDERPTPKNDPLVQTSVEQWFKDLNMFLDQGEGAVGYRETFFRKTATPMLSTWRRIQEGNWDEADRFHKDIRDKAWRQRVKDFIDSAKSSV